MSTEIKFPGYKKNQNSPAIGYSEGIAISSKPVIEIGNDATFPLYGSFSVSKKAASEFHPHLLRAVVILLRGPNPVTLNIGTGQILFNDDLINEGEYIRGFFNLDLFNFFSLAKVPSRYYVNASIFQYVSDVITINVIE